MAPGAWVQDILVKLDKGEMHIENYKLNQLRLLHIGAMPVRYPSSNGGELIFPRWTMTRPMA